jgi:hypothetical protein
MKSEASLGLPSRGCSAWKFTMAIFSASSSQWSRGIQALCAVTLP